MLRGAGRHDDDRQPRTNQNHIRHRRRHEQHRQQQQQQQQQQASIDLHQRVEMFVRYLMASRSLYSQLPDTFCSSETLSAGDYDICWNGTALAS